MARNYPKFLYQKVSGTKSDGEYIIHLQKPRLLFKVERDATGKIFLQCMDTEDFQGEIIKRATAWFISTLK